MFVSLIVRQIPLIRAISVHHIDLVVAIPGRLEDNATPIWQPERKIVASWVLCQICLTTAISIHDVDFSVAVSVRNENNVMSNNRYISL